MMKGLKPHLLGGLLALSLLYTACGSGRGVDQAEPSPADFATYVYPGGLFTLNMPPGWVVNDISDSVAVHVEFSPPGSPQPELAVFVVSSEEVPEDFEATVDEFVRLFYSDRRAPYSEIAREPQPDGSLRVKGIVQQPGLTTQHNDFLQQTGPYLVALRATLPDDPGGQRTLNRVLNSFAFNASAPWVRPAHGLEAAVGQGAVAFSSLNAWADSSGGFNVAGQIYNNATAPLEFVRVTAKLYGEGNVVLAEQGDFIAADAVEPGAFSPFEVSFFDGQPPGTVRYDLEASARYADFATETFYGPSNFLIDDGADFDANGLLVISGRVTNNGGQRASLVKVIVTVFDTEQRVIGTDTTLVEAQSLAPGETSTFRVQFAEMGGAADTYLATAQASLVP